MIQPFFLSLFFFFGVCCGLEIQAGEEAPPVGAVILVIDGLGAAYVYPEYSAYSLDGTSLGRAILFNLTGSGARILDLRVPVPETQQSHSILVTGDSNASWKLSSPTIFDQARREKYLCLAVLQRGDWLEMLLEQDGALYFENNSIHGPDPIMGSREGLPQDLRTALEIWKNRFQDYKSLD